MMDLPNHSVLVAGLDFWSLGGEPVSEPRLSQKLARVLDVPTVDLKTPPPADDDPTAPSTGITGFQFPEWFVTQDQEGQTAGGRSRLLVHRKALTRGKFIDRDKKRRPVVPVRFVRACRAGHIGDIDWYAFAHNGPSDCLKQQRQLFMDERGTSGDLTEVWVRCECGKAERSMAQAALLQNRALGLCDGAALARTFHKRDMRRPGWRSPHVSPVRHLDELPQHVAPLVDVVHAEADAIAAFPFVKVQHLQPASFQAGLGFGRRLKPDG